MNWLIRKLFPPRVAPALRRELALLPGLPPPGQLLLATQRFVVVDVESTGLNVNKDTLLSIGAVAINACRLGNGDGFEAVLAQPAADTRATVLLHGLGRAAVAAGHAPAAVLADFYRWAGPCVFLAFHAPFDRAMTERAVRLAGAVAPVRPWLDLAQALPALLPELRTGRRSLDDWAGAFGLHNTARHSAAADAYVTAELALVVLAAARRSGLVTVADLQQKIRRYQQLQELQVL